MRLLKSTELRQDLPPRRKPQMAFKLISAKFVGKLLIPLAGSTTTTTTTTTTATTTTMRTRTTAWRRPSSCDMVFNSDLTKTGVVTSPGYPNPYPSRTNCKYDFQGRGKERVQVIFQDFNLYHTPGDTDDCKRVDSLAAYVQIDGKMDKIDSFCGESLPRPIMSNGPRLFLEFHGVTSSRYSRGFKATYSFKETTFSKTRGKGLTDLRGCRRKQGDVERALGGARIESGEG
ncbi:suppressor of lurcher protein 1 isoform X1 [Vespula squamosa]|uniref:Suppressor of lurcher protein 1 isoform X1 n=1 Tax=Vespula squamosa TaxID=30214 RepID=A0ABD2A1Q4_VESSQ